MNSTELESKKKEILNVCLYQLTGVKNYMEEMNIRNCVDYAIEEIIKAAQQAPTWKNSQTGRYYVVTDEEKLKEIKEN